MDHLKLLPGIYVSRKDKIGSETVTTFDIRVTRPNCEPVMETGEIGYDGFQVNFSHKYVRPVIVVNF